MKLFEKVDYSKDPEAPISIGMKILKKLEKEGWRDADVYDAIEEIIISSDVKYPKQMAMRLKRTLENYDMWEAPYKGLVTKIQKWQFVNENAAVLANIAKAGAAISGVKSVLAMKDNKTNESEDDIDDFDKAYAAVDKMIHKYHEYTIDDFREMIDNGDFPFKDIMEDMGYDPWQLSDEEDEVICNIIIDAIQHYIDNVDNRFNQLHESISEDRYFRPMDVEKLYMNNKRRGAQSSRFEYYVIEAAMWARARSKNYHGYDEKWPAVQYKNGKFYAQTSVDGMTEVPFNYSVMTPEWLFADIKR